jgi:L-malate glycosyltransferase
MNKLAFISTLTDMTWGGSEFLWTMAAAEAIIQGHQVDCSISDWALAAHQIQQLNSQGARLYPQPRPAPLSIYARATNKVRRLVLPTARPKSHFQPIFDRQPDVICISQCASYDIGGNVIADLYELLQKRHIPYILVCQFNSHISLLNDKARSRVLKAFQGAAKVLFVSKQNHQLAEHHLAANIPNAEVIYNPVNIQDKSAVPFPHTNTISFASVARLEVSFKGQDVLFKILSQGQWRERDWQLNLYGSGEDLTYLRALAVYYQISDRVNFKGHVNDIRAVWQENQILLMPSHAEGCPLSLMEAMFCGRPAVVSDVGGNAECITEAETGFIAESPTEKSFGAAMETAWIARSSWEAMGQKAHDVAISKFDKHPEQSLLSIMLNVANRSL